MLPRTDVLKLSDEDLGLLYPGIDPAAFAADCLGKGAGLVALTRGGKGAFAWHASGACDVPPVVVDVIDTVGAGDTFQAALLTRLDELGALSPAGRAPQGRSRPSCAGAYAACTSRCSSTGVRPNRRLNSRLNCDALS
jgi:fructokinase